MFFRFVGLFALSFFAFAAATAVTLRARCVGRAEKLLAATLLWNLLVLAPIHLLGHLDLLYRSALGPLSIATSFGVFAIASRGIGLRENVDRVGAAMLSFVRLPYDAIVACARARSFVLVALSLALGVLLLSFVQVYLFPSDAWDGIMYHEVAIGYAIQHHGYHAIDLPPTLVQQANGFPRNVEMTGLWFSFFTDRRLVDIVNAILAIPLCLATFCIARRWTRDRVVAIGAAAALLLLPGVALELRSTLNDVGVGAYAMGAIHFATRRRLLPSHALLAAAAIGLTLGGKSMALAWVPPFAVVALVRFAWQRGRARWKETAVFGAIGFAIIGAFAASVYLRNWVIFKNPLWPVRIDVPRFGIHWPGVMSLAVADVNRPISEVWSTIRAAPVPGHDYHDTRVHGYGIMFPWVVIPLAIASVGVALQSFLRARRRHRSLEALRAHELLVLAGVMLIPIYASPALWSPRYNVPIVAVAFPAMLWLVGYFRARRAGDALVSMVAIANVISLAWCIPPLGGMTIGATLAFASKPAEERATIAPYNWTIAPPVAAARDRELGPGDVIAFSDDIEFLGTLWNERYSNQVVYIPARIGEAEIAKRLETSGAKWAVGKTRGAMWNAAKKLGWEEIGPASVSPPVMALRRK